MYAPRFPGVNSKVNRRKFMNKIIRRLMAMCLLTISFAAFAQSGDAMKQDGMKQDDSMKQGDSLKKDDLKKDKKSKKKAKKDDSMKNDDKKKDDTMKHDDSMKQN